MDDKDTVHAEFKAQLKSLKERYKQSTLKEKHKLNEHIKFILKTHGDKLVKEIEKDLT